LVAVALLHLCLFLQQVLALLEVAKQQMRLLQQTQRQQRH
jgi:hypothetical protein